MSADYVLKLDSEKIREMPMVDLAYELLKTANTPFYYRDLMMEIAKMRGLTESQVTDVIAQLYTEINIDGRFACVGGNVWGLKRWYPVERSDDPMNGGAKRPRIINDDDDEDDDDLYGEDDDNASADDETYDLFDEDREEVFEEGEEAAEADEEVLIEEDDDAEIEEDLEGKDDDDEDEFDDEDEDDLADEDEDDDER
ncbi:DNA-directed RNA polymerase subunit delta [Cohnella cholangitidis]|uniref:Probable DNA-directed RNA polymerase subunit delta n=1 Tax=Cohnella cholangitidis TaxID=2598458 RepID=A0A7G5C038_9BACL|nr:DNA-directed RNA polymerase subunit delta [Cohnella cholangitidis]QMV42572.1 DNA-directed RNA polymerase subunit delta [Cohnella cholangitidis]